MPDLFEMSKKLEKKKRLSFGLKLQKSWFLNKKCNLSVFLIKLPERINSLAFIKKCSWCDGYTQIFRKHYLQGLLRKLVVVQKGRNWLEPGKGAEQG